MSERYTHVAIALHWSIAGLIVIALALGLTIDLFPATLKSAAINAHALLGLAVLALSLYRLAWRLGHRPPELPATMSPLARLAAKLVHIALYALMMVVPLIGVPALLWRGRGLDLGLVQLASPFARTPEIYRPLTEAHELAAYTLVGLAIAHAGAAIYHHYVQRDDVLSRMAPWIR